MTIIGTCECGEKIGQTLVGDRLHWTHGEYVGAQVQEPGGRES